MANLNGTAGVDYCGYCKADYDEKGECNCNGFGHAKGSIGTCGYCGEDYFIAPGTDCGCDGFGNEKMTQYYDVWQIEDNTIVPVQVDVKAESPEQACQIIAQETGKPVEELQAFEASNPGFSTQKAENMLYLL